MTIARQLLAASLLALAAAPPAFAKPADFAAVVADAKRSADNRKQDEGRQPAAMLDFAQVKKGQTIADFMAGGGYYTELLARAVGPQGSVLPMNPPGFHDPKKWGPLLAAYPNVGPLVRPVHEMTLAPRSVDTIFTHLVFHDLYWESEQFKFKRLDVDAVLKQWFAALRPGGTVVIIDHVGPAGDTRATVEKLHRINPADARAAMERAGFVLDGESDALRMPGEDLTVSVFDPKVRGRTDRFVMRFRKPALGAAAFRPCRSAEPV
ncbi:MAG: class I SAM-dependent methyltransferase [Sphingopyxis sp.]|nr:class I SAM-dependent methyltransferase [Sphingopyxis sp.]